MNTVITRFIDACSKLATNLVATDIQGTLALHFFGFPWLAAIASATLASLLDFSVPLGFLVGAIIGVLPIVLARFTDDTYRSLKFLSVLNQTLFLALSVLVAIYILVSLLAGNSPQLVSNLPVFFIAVALYSYSILLQYTLDREHNLSLTRRLKLLFSGPPMLMGLALSITLTAFTLLALHYQRLNSETWVFYADKFLERGFIPPLTLLLFYWGVILMTSKYISLEREGRRLKSVDPNQETESGSNGRLTQVYDAYKSEFPNGTLELWLDRVWKHASDFYQVPRYLNWAIPILGFIGTVLGISLAASGIQSLIGSGSGLSQVSSQLSEAISPLGIAFDTTLIALSLSVILTLVQTLLQRWEDRLLLDYENFLRGQGTSDT